MPQSAVGRMECHADTVSLDGVAAFLERVGLTVTVIDAEGTVMQGWEETGVDRGGFPTAGRHALRQVAATLRGGRRAPVAVLSMTGDVAVCRSCSGGSERRSRVAVHPGGSPPTGRANRRAHVITVGPHAATAGRVLLRPQHGAAARLR